jgi:uncharacterized protein
MKKLMLFIIILLFSIVGIFVYLTGKVSTNNQFTNSIFQDTSLTPAPIPPPGQTSVSENLQVRRRPSGSETFAFQDLTIPYLRQRTYQSEISDMERINENTTYTSYIASYDSDGLKINGLLTVPKGEKPADGWPAVVFIHGYIAPEVYKTRVNYVSWTEYLARRGYVVYKIDLRGHDASEGVPGGAYYSSDYVIDTLNAHTALQNTNFVNPGAIGLWGHSMAGNVVFRSLAVKQDIPAVVIWAGAGYTYTDLQEYMIQDSSYRPPSTDSERASKRQELRDTYGNFDSDHWFWKQVPATNYLNGITGAVGLVHAVDDNVVSINYSRNLGSILDNTNIPHELMEYSNGGHNLTGSSFSSALQKTDEFFRLYLK